MIPDELLEQDENRGQDVPDNFEKRVKEVLENNVIEPPTYLQSFEVYDKERYGNEEGQSNP